MDATSGKPALYVLLEVEEDASPAELKAAYDRLLARHQNDPTPTAEERQMLLNQAYNILTNPKKREMYDLYGDKAWEVLQHPYIDAMFSHMDSHTLIKVSMVVLVVLTTMGLIQTILFALRIDETIKWNWIWCLLPVWVYDCILGLILLYLLFLAIKAWGKGEYETQGLSPRQIRRKRIDQVVIQVFFWAYGGYTVLFGWGLQHPTRALWGLYIFIPIAAEVVSLVSSLPKCNPKRIRARLAAQSGEEPKALAVGIVCLFSCILTFWRLVFLFIIGINRVWIKAGINWFLALIPVFLAIIAFWEYGYTFAKQKTTSNLQAMLFIVPMTFCQAMFMLSALLFAGKFQGAGRSVGDCLVPVYLVQFLLIAVSIGLFIAFRIYDRELRAAAEAKKRYEPGAGVSGMVDALHNAQVVNRPPPASTSEVPAKQASPRPGPPQGPAPPPYSY